VLHEVSEGCIGCGRCRKDCAFLQRYGMPDAIARNFDPAGQAWVRMAFECSLCRLCRAVCPVGVRPDELFLEMRRQAVAMGRAPFPEHARQLAYERLGMSRPFTFSALPAGCTRVLFPGCAFAGTRPERTRQIFATLRREDPSLGIVLDCCGRISRDLGREAFTRAMFSVMREYLVGHGVREVIVVCPSCFDMFREYGADLNARMIYEALPEAGVSSSRRQGTVMLHDPCGTRFHAGCHTAVRELLHRRGIEARDMEHTRELTFCCGSGGGVPSLTPDLARRWLERLAGRAEGNTLATYCAGCQQRMQTRAPTAHVLDILYDPEGAPPGRRLAAPWPLTYLNRLLLKRYFSKALPGAARRARPFRDGKETGALS